MTDIEKEQQRVYDEQMKKFIKDRKANAALKAKPMAEETRFTFKDFLQEDSYSVKTKDGKVVSWKHEGDWKKHKDKKNSDGSVQKPESRVRELARQKMHVESEEVVEEGTYSHDVERAFPNGKAPGVKVGPKAPPGTNTMPKKKDDKDEPFNYDEWKKSSVKPRTLPGYGKNGAITKMSKAAGIGVKESEEVVENSPFDWKGKSSVFTKKDEPTTSAQGGTIHKARTQDRNAETGGNAPKRSVGRPKGKYDGEYDIDRAKRDTKEYKQELSRKVMNAKAEGFGIRDEFKKHMHDALLRHQLKTSGFDPKDHEAAIAKKNPVKK